MYSVIIPVYNSEQVISKTVLRVCEFFRSAGINFEIILINDGSEDNSWEEISLLAKNHSEVTSVNLLKNYGQHHANLCGFRISKGDYLITMDDDLQNPPEEIGKLINMINDGYDLVIGQFQIKQHSIIRRAGSKFVGWLNRKIFNVNDHITLSNFRIINRDVIDRVCQDKSFSPYVPGLILKYSYRRCNVIVEHLPRISGKSNYTLGKIIKLIKTLLFNYSSIPLRWCSILGFIVSGTSFVISIYFLIDAIINDSSVPGWASIVVMLSFFNGVLIMLLSVIGEYLTRILRQINSHNSYEVQEVIRD